MKRIFVFLFLYFNLFLLFPQSLTVSFNDIKENYQGLIKQPNLKNLRTFSIQLDNYSMKKEFISTAEKHPAYKTTFDELNDSVKMQMSMFPNPWMQDAEDVSLIYDINEISLAFVNFTLEENTISTKSGFMLRMLLMSGSAIIFVLAVAFFITSRILRSKKEAILQSKYNLQGQEAERKRISEELHDTIAQNLKAQKFLILNAKSSQLKNDAATENIQAWEEIYKNSTENLKDIRSICQNLFPPDFANQKIEWIIAELCISVQKKSSVQISYSVNPENPVDNFSPENKLHLFRIMQESVNNAVNHSGCSSIKILLDAKKLEIKDDGNGFDVNHTIQTKTDHFGLRSIQERANLINAKCVIKSDSKGTVVEILFR